ncbi:MAG: peptidoglycan editing factor PgeF [Gammaproteobacteria bacterium]|nr:peptidoglycan editing factor PgeF [Gammaproteobacteria bacterium]
MITELMRPNWPAPTGVCALTTTRAGGVSVAPYDRLNLADHVGDDIAHVLENRRLLRDSLRLPAEPVWLQQVHGTVAVPAGPGQVGAVADASYTHARGVVCAVMTADCLPVLFCDRDGRSVAAAHAGWRGLVNGVLEQTVSKMDVAPEKLLAWLGPAIGPAAFEVGGEVRQAFVDHQAQAAQAFVVNRPGHFLADLYALARLRLQACGVDAIYGGEYCTFSQPDCFFSYRRQSRTGRMASLIWLDNGG